MRDSRNDFFFDKWEQDFNKTAKRTFRFGIAAWLGLLAINIVFWAVVIWAVIQLVQWVTAK